MLAIASLAQEVVAEVAVVVLPMLQKACPERVVEAVAAVRRRVLVLRRTR